MNVVPQKQKLIRLFRGAALVAGIAFIGWLIVDFFYDRDESLQKIDGAGIAASILVGWITTIATAQIFVVLVQKHIPQVSVTAVLSGFYYSQIAKYIPGRAAALLVQRSFLKGPNATGAVLIANIEITAITAFSAGAAAVALLLLKSSPVASLFLALTAICVAACLIHHRWLSRAARRVPILRKFFEPETDRTNGSSATQSLLLGAGILILPAAMTWTIVYFGLHFGGSASLSISSSLLISWIGALVIFIFPAGIGVREFLFLGIGNLLDHTVGAQALAEIAVVTRFVQVAVDVSSVIVFAIAARLWGNKFARDTN